MSYPTLLAASRNDKLYALSGKKNDRALRPALGYRTRLLGEYNPARFDKTVDSECLLVKAAQLASQEYNRSKDSHALHQQLTDLYRTNRLFEFEKVVEDNKTILLEGKLAQPAALFELIIKKNLQLRNINQAKFWLLQRKQAETENAAAMYLELSFLGLEAKYHKVRVLVEKVTPMKLHVLSQFVLVCEQMRDYYGASAYFKAALQIASLDNSMKEK